MLFHTIIGHALHCHQAFLGDQHRAAREHIPALTKRQYESMNHPPAPLFFIALSTAATCYLPLVVNSSEL